MSLFKKNQVIITALVIMVTIAGYLSYTQKQVPASTEVNKQLNNSEGDEITEVNAGEKDDDEGEENQEPSQGAVLTSISVNIQEYFIQAKFNREQNRAKKKDTYLEIINNSNLTEAQKNEAISQMISLADRIDKEALTEQLLQAKGFENAMVTINESSVDVIIVVEQLTDVEVAQIEDITTRTTGRGIEQVVITGINQGTE